ncbi:hypothetical protein RB195_008238 [Necator americanus]|uniref:Uncharacterized protein n=1 Tax=Necator americanus TaxID=51031 RepID=A0ABR1CMN2_NECAM
MVRVPEKESWSSISTEGRPGRSERRRMQKEVPPTVNIGLRTKKRVDDVDSITECIEGGAKKTIPVLAPRKKFAFASP